MISSEVLERSECKILRAKREVRAEREKSTFKNTFEYSGFWRIYSHAVSKSWSYLHLSFMQLNPPVPSDIVFNLPCIC